MTEQDTLKQIRNKNLSDILQVLRKDGACSLLQLSENTQGGQTTVKKCVQQALDMGMLFEGETADSTGGRRAKQYVINNDYQYFMCILIDNNELIYKIFDFGYNCACEYSLIFKMKEFKKLIYGSIENALTKYNIGTVCISLPCIVKKGVIVDWYYNPDANGLDIKGEIEKRYGVNAIVQNDMKLTVIGESDKNRGKIENIATVQFGHNGMGVGEMVNGHLLEGNSGFAGEVGYLNDISKNIRGISFPAKIVRNIIIYINPRLIVFYRSDKQNQIEKVFETAVRDLPDYVIPEYEISDGYLISIINGFKALIDKYGYFKLRGKGYEETVKRQNN